MGIFLAKIVRGLAGNSRQNFSGQVVSLERPERLAYKENLRTRWITVVSNGDLQDGVTIDIATMNLTDPLLADQPRDVRLARALTIKKFMNERGLRCDIIENGSPLIASISEAG